MLVNYLSHSFFYDNAYVCVRVRVWVNKLQPIFWSKANDGVENDILDFYSIFKYSNF